MGTSKRKLSNEIKKILNGRPLSNINDVAPELTKKILSEKALNDSFDNEITINNLISIIAKEFTTLDSAGFKGKSKQELITDHISKQEFIEMILDQVENSTIIESKILEKAFKIVMGKFLEVEEFDVYSFAQLLFFEIVYQILLSELNDNIKDIFEELEYNKIQNMVKNVTNQIMNEKVYIKVNLFIDRKISLDDILKEITIHTSQASFGDF